MHQIPCVIFAGGKSSRMGEDKVLLPFGGFDTLTQFQLHRLSKLFKTVYISCKDRSKFPFQADFIEDVLTENIYAPTAGFLSVFESLACAVEGSEEALLACGKFFALSVDTPFIGESEIKKIIEADISNPHAEAIIAKTACGIHPMVGIYSASLKEKFLHMLKNGDHKLTQLLKNADTVFVEFESEEPFLNINHPHEYQNALSLQIQKR